MPQGDQKHLLLAHLFDKPCFLGLLALKVVLSNKFQMFLVELLSFLLIYNCLGNYYKEKGNRTMCKR